MRYKVDVRVRYVVSVTRADMATAMPRSPALGANVGARSQLERPGCPRSSVPISRPSPSYKPTGDVVAHETCGRLHGNTPKLQNKTQSVDITIPCKIGDIFFIWLLIEFVYSSIRILLFSQQWIMWSNKNIALNEMIVYPLIVCFCLWLVYL